jgi:hypothetical protein
MAHFWNSIWYIEYALCFNENRKYKDYHITTALTCHCGCHGLCFVSSFRTNRANGAMQVMRTLYGLGAFAPRKVLMNKRMR